MLTSLSIENIAVIRRAELDLTDGFTVLTGETGAGKSLLMDSIGLLLGARSSRDLIRTGEERAFVSGIFRSLNSNALALLAEQDFFPDEDGCICLTRALYADGRSQTKLNGRTITLAQQKMIAPLLIGIHGQHDSQFLLDPRYHLSLLDDYADNASLRDSYTSLYQEMTSIQKRIRELSISDREKTRRSEQLSQEVAEIDRAKLKKGEEEELEVRREMVQNREKIAKQARLVTRALYRSEKGMPAYELVKRAITALESISDCVPDADNLLKRLLETSYELEDIGLTVSALADTDYDDPTLELDRIETRLSDLSHLHRKYGDSIEEILAYRDRAQAELDEMELSELTVKELTASLAEIGSKARQAAALLSESRKKAAQTLSEQMTEELTYLEMPKARFAAEVSLLRNEAGVSQLGPDGGDVVSFLFTANVGEPPKPLAKIASGGELSRLMLALKTVARDRTGADTLIFDEIDAGVSGRTAQKIGLRLRALSKQVQILCVTHSAQVASCASHQFKIEKKEIDGRASTALNLLSEEERVAEIARIMGGMEITETLLCTAREMLDAGEKAASSLS